MSNIRSILFYKKLKIIKNSLNKKYKIPKKNLNMDDEIETIKVVVS
jgi:hypothetical protein